MEENSTLIDFARICRLCMTEETAMSSLFCDKVESVPLPLRIMACVSIEISQTDGLPSLICNKCYSQVNSWYKFKNLCESTDSTLRKLIQQEPVPCETINKILKTAEDVKKGFQICNERPYTPTNFVEPFDNIDDPVVVENSIPVSTLREERKKTTSDDDSPKIKNEFSVELDGDFDDAESLDVLGLSHSNDDLRNGTHKTDENGADDYSSDDNLSLMVQREKFISEKRNKKRARVRKQCKAKEKGGKLLRTIQMQTSMDDGDSESFEIQTEEFKFKGEESESLHLSEDSQRKLRNKRTQTLGVAPTSKKRFRVRPAIPSACTLCGKIYKNSEILRQHLKSHHVSGTIECQQCHVTFSSLRSLKYHEQRKHSNLEPLPCSFCGKKFLDKKYLRIHENIHSQANQYVCQFCGRKFIMKTNLTVHISRHHTQKTNDFICQVCGKAFPFKLYLKKHFKTHTDYKPHACPQCDARFRENTLLRKHINSIHLKLRPFHCEYCHKTFTRSLYLREHMEYQHLGIPKKVECPICGESFQNRSRLRQHECKGRLEVL